MITVTAQGLVHAVDVAEQLNFFDDGKKREKNRKLETTVDNIRERFGRKSITNLAVINNDIGIDFHKSRSND